MINETFRNICIEILALNKAEEEFIHYLYVRPRYFQHRLVFLWVKGFSLGIDGRWYRPEEILAKHVHDSWVHRLGDDLSVVRHVVK